MRKIKFRAWDPVLKEMIGIGNFDYVIRFSGKVTMGSIAANVELMQYTGLKDKNGAEVYEGDVLRLAYETIQMDGHVMAKDDGEWIFYKDEMNFLGVHHNRERVTVIGNIYENPELLTK